MLIAYSYLLFFSLASFYLLDCVSLIILGAFQSYSLLLSVMFRKFPSSLFLPFILDCNRSEKCNKSVYSTEIPLLSWHAGILSSVSVQGYYVLVPFLSLYKKQPWKHTFSTDKHLVLKGKDEHLFCVSKPKVSAALCKVIDNFIES